MSSNDLFGAASVDEHMQAVGAEAFYKLQR